MIYHKWPWNGLLTQIEFYLLTSAVVGLRTEWSEALSLNDLQYWSEYIELSWTLASGCKGAVPWSPNLKNRKFQSLQDVSTASHPNFFKTIHLKCWTKLLWGYIHVVFPKHTSISYLSWVSSPRCLIVFIKLFQIMKIFTKSVIILLLMFLDNGYSAST